MTYLLDANIVSETSKPQPDERVIAWLLAHRGQCVMASVTLAEMRYGIERLPDGKRKAALETKYKFMADEYAGLLYDFDGPAATEWGRYAAELEAEFGSDWWKVYDFRDTQLAAIAREYGLTIATRNEKDFPFCDVINPFKVEA